jgi:hypothetical protein
MKLNNQSTTNTIGTNFSSETSPHFTHGEAELSWIAKTPTLMSKEGEALVRVTAPSSAFVVSNKSTAAVKETK